MSEDWRDEAVAKLREMITDWEETMGPEDKTFYSLGLRRAIDVITKIDATVEVEDVSE